MASMTIKLQNKEVELTFDEAKELHAFLETLFGKPNLAYPMSKYPIHPDPIWTITDCPKNT